MAQRTIPAGGPVDVVDTVRAATDAQGEAVLAAVDGARIGGGLHGARVHADQDTGVEVALVHLVHLGSSGQFGCHGWCRGTFREGARFSGSGKGAGYKAVGNKRRSRHVWWGKHVSALCQW